MIQNKYSFRLLTRAEIRSIKRVRRDSSLSFITEENEKEDRRAFLKFAGLVGLGLAATQLLPKKAEALVFGGTPASNVVGLKNANNTPINPATEDTLVSITTGLKILKTSVAKTSSGVVLAAGGQKIRIYNLKFSLSADQASVAFNFGVNGAFETYLAPKTGGLYGANNQPNYVEGGAGEDLKITFPDAGNVQVNVDYLLV